MEEEKEKTGHNLPHQEPEEDTIDLIALAKTLWEGRKIVIWSVAIFAVLGVFVAIYSLVEYEAKTILVPQVQSSSSNRGNLGSLAAMAGINLGSSGTVSELSPVMYPQILKSIPFQKSIMNTPLSWEGISSPVSMVDYPEGFKKQNPLSIVKKYTIGLPGVMLNLIKGDKAEIDTLAKRDNLLEPMTAMEKGLRGVLDGCLSVELNREDGSITLSATSDEAFVAAQLVQKSQELLQDMVTDFKIEKANQNLAYVRKLYEEKKLEFEESQQKLASFRDRNLDLNSALARTEEDKLQSDYQLAFSVYSDLATQLASARIKVKEDSPVFSVIEPVSVPTKRSKPDKKMILIIWIFLGGIVGTGWVFGKQFLKELKEKWSASE